MPRRLKLVHLITSLTTGGAERMLLRIVERMDPHRFETVVISLMSEGTMGAGLRRAGALVEAIGMNPGELRPLEIYKLTQLLRTHRPDILQTWMYHADLLGTMAAISLRIPALAWNLRCSELEDTHTSRFTRLLPRLLARLSSLPNVVVVNSQRGQTVHKALGYHPKRWAVLPNGFDLAHFQPGPEHRASMRNALELPPGAAVVGLLARFDPMKDHETFFRAIAHARAQRPDLYCVLAGRDITAENPTLATLISETKLAGYARLLGERNDIPQLLSAWDVAVSSSAYGEGFPNVVGEAMACGVPCVVTAVGDASVIVGDTGLVVPPRAPEALANALLTLLAETPEQRHQRGLRARKRVQERFELASIVRQYESLYEQLAAETALRS